jgi:hypothetical protein
VAPLDQDILSVDTLSPCPPRDIKEVFFNKVCGEDDKPQSAGSACTSILPTSQKPKETKTPKKSKPLFEFFL